MRYLESIAWGLVIGAVIFVGMVIAYLYGRTQQADPRPYELPACKLPLPEAQRLISGIRA
tara:strand:- start:1357 stop:1536 length:180 start_codon:yes stop_codon:yes gene_type:complete